MAARLRPLCAVLVLVAVVAAASAFNSRAQESVKDPVCGMSVDPAKTKYSAEHDGKTYYFCSASCVEKFKKEPARYTQGSREATKVKDPVCGMDVEVSKAKFSTTHDGKTYYFCSAGCVETFKKDPGKYIK